ncbi:MAG: LysM peptidoglycan-binding domain-containing protein [Lachnospiraceae bacterium]|nr:LysM peptidoglycan-binding domain-containing protein [Lachnospiraceae bacterium]
MKKYVLILTVLLTALFCVKTIAFGKNEIEYKIHYESVEIKNGDNLWNIAEEYNSPLYTTKEYVYIIMDFNHMKNSNILPNQKIIVPVYKPCSSVDV